MSIQTHARTQSHTIRGIAPVNCTQTCAAAQSAVFSSFYALSPLHSQQCEVISVSEKSTGWRQLYKTWKRWNSLKMSTESLNNYRLVY